MAHRDRASSRHRGSSPSAWILALSLVAACEREGDTQAPASVAAGSAAPAPAAADAPEATAPADPAPADPSVPAPAADLAPAEPSAPAPAAATAPAEPSRAPSEAAAGDPAQVERVLAEYAAIERFFGPPPAETTEAEDELLRSWLPGEQFELYGESHPDMVRKAWLERMSRAVARGEPPSTIRMPLQTNVGWGCEVPSMWVATGNFGPDTLFILPVGDTELVERCNACYGIEDDERRGECVEQRCALQVQGRFTGKITKPTERCTGIGHELHIERATASGVKPSPFFLALPGGAPPPDGPPIAEGPRWGVLFASAFRHDANARERADALQARLAQKGHASAQVLDSRRIPTLWCCSFAVLVERFDDEKAAKALAKRLKREGFTGALVRELY